MIYTALNQVRGLQHIPRGSVFPFRRDWSANNAYALKIADETGTGSFCNGQDLSAAQNCLLMALRFGGEEPHDPF